MRLVKMSYYENGIRGECAAMYIQLYSVKIILKCIPISS